MRASSFDLLSAYNYFIPGWIDFLWIGITLFVGILLSSLVTLVLSKAHFPLIYIQLIAYPLMFLPTMFFASTMSRKNMFRSEEKPLDFPQSWSWKNVAVATAAMISAAFICDAINLILPPMPEDLLATMNMLKESPVWASFLCVSVFAPFMEEWLCRGMILRGLLGKVKAHWAVLISALFFGLIHANWWQGLPAFFIALLLGYIYHKTGSLKLTMWMHAVNNTLSLILMKIPALDSKDNFYEIIPGLGWYIGAMCLSVILLTLCIIYFTKSKSPLHAF